MPSFKCEPANPLRPWLRVSLLRIFSSRLRIRLVRGSTSKISVRSGNSPPLASRANRLTHAELEAATVGAKHNRRQHRSIEQHRRTLGERRSNHLLEHLGLARRIKQQLGARAQLEVGAIARQLPNLADRLGRVLLADSRQPNRDARAAQMVGNQLEHRALAGTVDALERDHARCRYVRGAHNCRAIQRPKVFREVKRLNDVTGGSGSTNSICGMIRRCLVHSTLKAPPARTASLSP